jgi:uncharacterized protein involved in exopolysaccharide biosynthesis
MRRFFETFVESLRLDSRSRRVLDETLGDWRHEDASVDGLLRQWTTDLRSACSVIRALVLVSWWKPNAPMAQMAGGGAVSARDEVINVITSLPPEASYEDILRELAALKAAKGEAGGGAGKSWRRDPAFWLRAVRTTALFLVVTAIGAAIQTYTTTPMYVGIAKVRAEPGTAHISAVQEAQHMLQTAEPEAFMQTELAILQSRDLKRHVVRRLLLDQTHGGESAAIDELAANLGVILVPAQNIFIISYSAPSRELAVSVANALAEEYVTQNLERKTKAVKDQVETINRMLSDTQTATAAARKLLVQQTNATNVVDPTVMAGNVQEAQREYTQRDYEAQARRVTAEEMSAFDVEKNIDAALSHPNLVSSVAPFRATIAGIDNEIARLTYQRVGPSHPAMLDAHARLASAKQELKTEVERHIDAARKAAQTAERQRAQAEQSLRYWQGLAVKNTGNAIPWQTLKDQIAANEQSYQALLSQQNQLELFSRGVTNNVAIVEEAAAPQRPHTPRTALIFAVWLGIGLAAAAMTLLLTTRRRVASAAPLPA